MAGIESSETTPLIIDDQSERHVSELDLNISPVLAKNMYIAVKKDYNVKKVEYIVKRQKCWDVRNLKSNQ